MLHSMTGFARQSAEFAFGAMTWELRAVNHRYLDVSFRLPDELRANEADFRQQVSGRLGRGKVECTLNFRRALDRGRDLALNLPLVELLSKRVDELAAVMPGASGVSPLDVLRWPGVVQQPEIDTGPLAEAAAGLLDSALSAIAAMRASEGRRIAAMLEGRLSDVDALAGSVRSRMPEVLEAARRKQRERIAKLDIEADPARLEVELALLAQKLDVDEELDRLLSHLSEIRNALAAAEPVGRRLDFLMQELNREANTLGSKSADAETTRAAVELKVLIEQMREQVQNVE